MNLLFKRLFLSVTLASGLSAAYAQSVTYQVNTFTNTGNPGGLNVETDASTTGWTSITTAAQTTNSWSAVQTIPFAFEFYGNPVTQYRVSQNGVLTFSTTSAIIPGANQPVPTASLPDSSLAVFWDDFTASPPTGTNDYVYVKTFGTAPNRQLWVRWFSFEYGNPANSFAYFSVVLEETTNNIYFVDVNYFSGGSPSSTIGVQLNSAIGAEYSSAYAFQSGGTAYTDNDYFEFSPYTLVSDNAALVSIDAPVMPVCTLGQNTIVTLGNQGTDTLFTATIGWSVNGITQTPFMFNDTITPLATQSAINIGTYPFADGDTLVVWVSSPNGNSDGDTSNDTLSVVLRTSLNGAYTIGGTSPDYTNFTLAVNDLISFGICGPVVFNVADGIYQEKLVLPQITGANILNTITFQSVSGDNSTVTIVDSSLATTTNYTVKFDGGDYIRFYNISFRNIGATYARVLEFENFSDQNIISGCKISGSTTAASTSTNYAVVYSGSGSTSLDNYNQFLNNTIEGGSYGVYWYGGSSTNLEFASEFHDNIFRNNYYAAARLYYQDSPEFTGNSVSTNSAYASGFDSYYFGYCDNQLVVTNNKINTNISGDGIYLYFCDGNAAMKGLVANNFISHGDTASTTASNSIYLSSSDYQVIAFNSIMNHNNSASDRGIYVTGLNNEIKNNNIYVYSSGVGIYYSSGVSISDYNNVYVPSGFFGNSGGSFVTLSSWQTNTGYDLNSLSVDPMFQSWSDLHTCNDSLDGQGIYLSLVTTDYDGQTRSTTPDIGADEFSGLASITLADDILKCAIDTVFYDLTVLDTAAIYSWSTGDTTPTLSVTAPGLYYVTVTTTCGVKTDSVTITNVPVPVADFSYVQSFFTAIFENNTVDADSYLWIFGDGDSSTAEEPIHVYFVDGTYTVTLIATNECESDTITNTFTTSTIGMEELTPEERINVYPNPSNGEFNVSMFFPELNEVNVDILDLNGKVLWTREQGNVSGEVKMNIDVNYPAGVYLLRVTTSNGVVLKRITVL